MITSVLIGLGHDPSRAVGDGEVQHLPAHHEVVQSLHHLLNLSGMVPWRKKIMKKEKERRRKKRVSMSFCSPASQLLYPLLVLFLSSSYPLPILILLPSIPRTYTSERKGGRCNQSAASSNSPSRKHSCSSSHCPQSSLGSCWVPDVLILEKIIKSYEEVGGEERIRKGQKMEKRERGGREMNGTQRLLKEDR